MITNTFCDGHVLDFNVAAAGIHRVGSSVAEGIVYRVDAALERYGVVIEVDEKLSVPVFRDYDALSRHILAKFAQRAVDDADNAHYNDSRLVCLGWQKYECEDLCQS